MANTEGKSDEFVAALATATAGGGGSNRDDGTAVLSASAAAGAAHRRQHEVQQRQQLRTQAAERRQRRTTPAPTTALDRVQQRMDLPLGTVPAATVIRRSKNRNNGEEKNNEDGAPISARNNGNSTDSSNSKRRTAPPSLPPQLRLVGDIMEHNTTRSTTSNTGTPTMVQKKISKFKLNRNRQSATTGFPSVHDQPFGAFVTKKTTKKNNNNNTQEIQKNMTIEGTAQQEAQAMLAGMSLQEIHEHQHELHQALSPEMIAFLQQRQQNMKQNRDYVVVKNNKEEKKNKTKKGTAIITGTTNNTIGAKVVGVNSQVAEKERLAKLVASITTYDEMDTIYQQENVVVLMTHDESENDTENDRNQHTTMPDNTKEQFLIACDLLRSSSPRQTVWAARLVRNVVTDVVQQQQQHTSATTSTTTTATTGTSPRITIHDFPTVLPVSLRCVLDTAFARSCHYVLHTYVLQSLYALTILYAHPDHDVLYYDAFHNNPASAWTYQDLFLDDAVPVPSVALAYPPMAVRSVAMEDTTGTTNAPTAAAYTTASSSLSSSSSALKDGEEFQRDPMWTLLSKMKILPRLAFLLEHYDLQQQQQQQNTTTSSAGQKTGTTSAIPTTTTNNRRLLPEEAWIAICGIVSMVGQRSPGAASAIVQHKTLTSQLLKRMLEEIQQRRQQQQQQPQPQQHEEQKQEQIENNNTDSNKHPRMGLVHATMRMFCILARQSRSVAECLPMEEMLPPLLVIGDGIIRRREDSSPSSCCRDEEEFRIQQLGLVLWRTMLRYGLGLEALQSMLTISAKHLALPQSYNTTSANTSTSPVLSLSSEFLSAFALVLDCVKVVWNKTETTTGDIIDPESMMVLTSATKMMASTIQLVLPKQQDSTAAAAAAAPVTDTLKIHTKEEDETNDILNYRWNASRLQYLSTWFQLFDPMINNTKGKHRSLEDYVSIDNQETILRILHEFSEPKGGKLEQAWNLVSRWCDPSLTFHELASASSSNGSIKVEAAACAFIHGYFSVALVLLRLNHPTCPDIEGIKRSLHNNIVRTIIVGLESTFVASQAGHRANNVPADGNVNCKYTHSRNSAREGWIIQSHFAIAKFCFHSMSIGLIRSSSDMSLVRSMVFALLGRLQKGNESIAAVLYSSDVLFQTSGNPVHQSDDTASSSSTRAEEELSSPISSMFLGEICGSVRSRKQLDHSFKLQHGFGLTSNGFGPFALDSLLGTAEQPNTGPTSTNSRSSTAATTTTNNDDNITEDPPSFPLGKFWLWQCLSGSIRMKDDTIAVGTEEATNVIVAVLELILEQDETEDVMGIAGYMARLSTGSKLYYLMNVCLQPERVFRNERILTSGEDLLDRYLHRFGVSKSTDTTNNNDVIEFCQECFDHSSAGHDNKNNNSLTGSSNGEEDDLNEDAMEEKDKKLLDDFAVAMSGNTNSSITNSQIPSEQYRAIEAFVEDLTTAYRDYGAQYDFYTKCIRVFLLPMFPTSIRCRALKELDNMLHLLTLTKECDNNANDNDDDMVQLVSNSFLGGLTTVDHSKRDEPELLDAVTRILARSGGSSGDDPVSSPRPLDGYMRHYCIGLLVRNFASSLAATTRTHNQDSHGGNDGGYGVVGLESSKLRLQRLGRNNRNVQTEICTVTTHVLLHTTGTKHDLVSAVIKASSSSRTTAAEENSTTVMDDDPVEKCIQLFQQQHHKNPIFRR